MATVDRRSSQVTGEGTHLDEEGIPWLENGESMDQETFHERYKKTPTGFKAELIGGIVYVMASPVYHRHGRNDANVGAWLWLYCSATDGTEVQVNTTAIFDAESEPQPDSALLILPEFGGQTRDGQEDTEGEYTIGAPELVAEVAASSRSIDLRSKFEDYQRAGVREYLVLDLNAKKLHWFVAGEAVFVPLLAGEDGLFRSRTFPGLWLDPSALIDNDKRRLTAILERGLASPEHAAFVAELQRRRDERSKRRHG